MMLRLAAVVFALVVLVCVVPSITSLPLPTHPNPPQLFFPPNGGPLLTNLPNGVANVAYDFDFYHKTTYAKDALVHFNGRSRRNQPLATPLQVSFDRHEVVDAHHPVVVWTFREAGHVLASTVVTEDVFNSTGLERDPSPFSRVPTFDPSKASSWIIGSDLTSIPSPIVSDESRNMHNEWRLFYTNTVTGKVTTVIEQLGVTSSPVPVDLVERQPYALRMRFCNSQSQQCSFPSPPVTFEILKPSGSAPPSDLLQGSGVVTFGYASWASAYHPNFAQDHALLELEIYRVHVTDPLELLERVVAGPVQFPLNRTLPFGQYIAVWTLPDPDRDGVILFNHIQVYHHPAVSHRSSYPTIPVFANTADAWVVGPNPRSIQRPTTNNGNLDGSTMWSVEYTSPSATFITHQSIDTMTSQPPAMPAGKYAVRLLLAGSGSGRRSLPSPSFMISVLGGDSQTGNPTDVGATPPAVETVGEVIDIGE